MSLLLLGQMDLPSKSRRRIKERSLVDSPYFSTSPSAYVVLEGISATGPCGIIGPTYASLTTSYAESDVSSFRLNQPGLPYTINYADFFSNCTTRAANYTYPRPSCEIELGDSIVNQYPSCVSQINLLSQSMNYDQLHCYPYISYPSGLQAVNSAWATCVDSSDGGYFAEIFDPPRALTSSHALGPAPTKDPGNAIPAASPSQPLPSKTASSPGESSPTSGSKHDPPDQNPSDPGSSEDPPIPDPRPKPGPANDDTELPVDSNTAALQKPSSPSSSPGTPGKSPSAPVDNAQDSDPGTPKSPADEDGDPSNGSNSIDLPNDPANADPQPNQPPQTITTVHGHTIQTASSPDVIIVDGHSVTRNEDSIQISGTPVALHSNGDFVLGTSTIPNLLPVQSPTPTSVFTIGSQPFTLSSNNLIGAGTTLRANDPITTIHGTIVSLGSSALRIGSSFLVPVTPAPVITAAAQAFTVLSNGIAIAGTTLTTNAPPITVSGTPISLGPQGVVIGGTTMLNLPHQPKPTKSRTRQPETLNNRSSSITHS